MRRIFGSLLIIFIVLAVGVVLIIYAQGKRLDKSGKLIGVGIIQIDSSPDDASVYINGKFRAKSDTNIEDLKPGNYIIKIEKDHYHTWEKLIEVREGHVTPVRLKLFPSNPSLTALSFDGVYAPNLSPDKKLIVFGKQTADDPGLFVFEFKNNQFFFGSSSEEKKIVADNNDFSFSKSSFEWSPDSKSVLVQSQKLGSTETKFFLLDANKLNESFEDVTTKVETLRQTWETERKKAIADKLKKFSKEIIALATEAKKVLFTKDNQAVLIIKPDNSAVVQDLKPSPVPNTKPATYNLPTADSYAWFEGSVKHLLSIDGNTLSVLDSDGTNKFSLFTGDFDTNAVFGWPDGSKISITINLNTKSNPLPNFYSIELD